ncbi:hypothetical protein ACHAPQ_009632 [Fusarium lateritium]
MFGNTSNTAPSADGSTQSAASDIPSLASRLFRQVGYSASKSWQDRGDIIRHSKELFTAAPLTGLSYSPLPTPSSIRLLQVKPGAPSEIIDCSLITVSLLDAPEYRPLSYTWEIDRTSLPYDLSYLSHKKPDISKAVKNGMSTINHKLNNFMVSPQPWNPWAKKPSEDLNHGTDADSTPASERDKILCNGQGVYVKPNLYQALIQIRKTRPGLYWIDAICINQADTAERGQQVQMMDQIYSSAAQVIVWLGTCPQIFAPGVKNMMSVAKTGFPAQPKETLSIDFIYLRVGTTSAWHLVLCVVFLITRKWFRRLWVLQELCLAKQATFFLGDYEMEANDISAAFVWMLNILKAFDTSGWYTFSQLLVSLGDMPEQAISLLNSRQTISQGHKIGLQDWLRIVQGREAKDPRDMIYGGLALLKPEALLMDPGLKERPATLPPRPKTQGVTSNGPSGIKASWPKLQADYEISLSSLLDKVAICLLSGTDPMDLLSLATRYRNPYFYDKSRDSVLNFSMIRMRKQSGTEATTPSWFAMPWMQISRLLKPLIWQGGTSCEYTAKMTNKPFITSDGKTLCLDAVYLDTIEDCVLFSLFGDLTPDAESMAILGSKSEEAAETTSKMIQFFNYSPAFQLLDLAIAMQSDKGPAQEAPLEMLCDILLAGSWQDTGLVNNKVIAFCQWLDDWVRGIVKDHEKEKSEATNHIPTFKDRVIAKLQDDYSKLKTTYPDQPWSADDGKNIPEDRKVLAVRFSQMLPTVQVLRCLFKTKKGMLVLAPAWAEKGDVVMGVKGGKVPYVFTPRDEDLRRKVAFKENYKSGLAMEVLKKRIGHNEAQKWDVDHLRSEIGKRDCYILTGEAYIHPSSLTELFKQSGEFSRIEII